MEEKIEDRLNTFKKQLSIAKEENLFLLKKELKIIEQEIDSLEQREETIILFGYYKYEFAKLCIDSGKFPEQKTMFENHLKLYLVDHQEYSKINSQQINDSKENIIENQFNALKKSISISKEEDLSKIKEQIIQFETEIKSLEHQQDTIKQFGYYKYELANLCVESGKLPSLKYKYEKHLKQYSDDHKEYFQTISSRDQNELSIDNLLKAFQKNISVAKEQDLDKIKEELTIIDSKIKYLKEKKDTISQFGYYKYEIAKIFLESGKFPDQKFKYEKHLKYYSDDHKEYFQAISYSDQSGLNLENLLKTFQKNISAAKEKDLAKIKEELKIIESKIDSLEQKEETINQFRYYKQELAKICIESDKFLDQKFRFEKYLNQYSHENQQHSFNDSRILNNLNIKYQPHLSQTADSNQELSQFISTQISTNQKDSILTLKTQNQVEKYLKEEEQEQVEEEEEEQKSDVFSNIEDDIQEEQKYKEQLLALYQKNKKRYYLILGETGAGKSSFVKNITDNPNIKTSNGQDSHTQFCQIFENDGKEYIDTPGLNDTKKNKCEILLNIVGFLKNKKLILDNLFILLVQSKDLKKFDVMREFSYTYFLYELFGDNIDHLEVEKLIKEYNLSSYLLNWSDVGFHDIDDALSDKRKIIFENKKKASNYFEYIYSYHIRILTFFDKKSIYILKQFDKYQTEFLKEQIWSHLNQEQRFHAYNDYIKNQKAHLLIKIEEILRLETKNKSLDYKKDFQNILLIGESQVGKSSLIEQLTNQKGLRGTGNQSQTQVCFTYRVDYGNTVYRFIDTPGYEGSENNQNPYHNFKIIADYLQRSDIKEFKLLFMINKGINVRLTIFNVLYEFFQFIAYIFDQDVSFLNRQYLEDLLSGKNDVNMIKILLKDKVLQIFRIDNDEDNINQFNQEFLQYTLFKSDFRTNNGELIQVPQNEDNKQKKQLFAKINNIDSFTLDDKATFRIKKSLLENIIFSSDQFMSQFKKIAQKYQKMNDISSQINKIIMNDIQKNTNKLAELNKNKQEIVKELKIIQFNVLIHVFRQIQDQVKRALFPDKVKNDSLRHFLPIQQNPILFEITDENPESIFISKKQHQYSLLAHQLSKFIDLKKHQKKLEDLSEIYISQEICFQQIEQSKSIEQNYEQKPEENILKLEQLSSLINYFKLKGIQANRHFTYFSTAIQSMQFIPIIGFAAAEFFLAPLRMGYDAYQLLKGQMCKKQFYLNSSANTFGLILSAILFSVPGIGQILGFAVGFVTCIIYGVSAYMYTSTQTFDSTIGICFQKIINETNPNQALNYYEMPQLLKDEFNLTNFSQLKQKQGYKMFRQLEKNNFENNQKMLDQLFKPKINEKLKDVVSKFIVQNYILSQISQQIEFQQQKEEKNKDFLKRCLEQLQKIQFLIQTFYNKSDQGDVYSQAIKKSVKIIKLKLNSEKKRKEQQNNVEFDENEKKILEDHQTEQKKFINGCPSKITYEEQVKLADGALRLDGRFQILFNSYCNLQQLKVKQKLKQPTIQEIEKDEINMKFKINQNNSFQKNSIILTCCDNKLTEMLNIMSMVNKYIENRYLTQVNQKDQPNLSSLAESEVLENELKYSIDLHDLTYQFQEEKEEKDFIILVEKKLRKILETLFKVEQEKDKNKQDLLRQAIDIKVSVLNSSEMNYRLRCFYKSVQYLKDYFKN